MKDMLLNITAVSPDNKDVQKCIAQLDQYQLSLYGAGHCNLDPVDQLKQSRALVLGAYIDNELAGIGAVKLFDEYGEIKRMFIDPRFRGTGIASMILQSLEKHTRQQKRAYSNLETGCLQHAAIAFYRKHGYTEVEKFGSYHPNPVSVYFSKKIQPL